AAEEQTAQRRCLFAKTYGSRARTSRCFFRRRRQQDREAARLGLQRLGFLSAGFDARVIFNSRDQTLLPLHFNFWRTTLKNDLSGIDASCSVFFAFRIS